MTVTVADIVRVPGMPLKLLAGDEAADRSVRWVHASELEDPTPWLKGGELLLTTGMGVGATAAKQRAYVERLVEAGVAGLGFGLGFSHDKVPAAIRNAAERGGLPLFEVPYPVPFIAITEAVFSRIAAEQYDLLHRAVEAEHALTRAVMEGRGIEGVAASLAEATHGWVLLLDLHGLPLVETGGSATQRADRIWEEVRASRPPSSATFSLTLVDQGHHVWIQPVGPQGRVEAFLAVGKPDQPSQLDRIVAAHALSLFAIELEKSRAVEAAERRLQGDLLGELVAGTMKPAEADRGLARFGFARGVEVVAVSAEGGPSDALGDAAADLLSRGEGAFLISPFEEGIHLLLPADPPVDLAELVKGLRERTGLEVRAGAGAGASAGDVARAQPAGGDPPPSLREAGYALQVCRLEGWDHAGFEDLGTYRLLLSMADPDALRAFADSMLAPLDEYDREQRGELIASLLAFLQHNARWEAASAALYVHRHTLRYRMRKVEELTGRDLGNPFDRMEFWLALRARDLLRTDEAG